MYLYLLQSGETDCYKIGIAGNIKFRIRDLQSGNPHPIKLIASANTDREVLTKNAAAFLEHGLHLVFKNLRLCGEWFRLGDEEVELVKNSYRVFEEGTEEQILGLSESWNRMIRKHGKL